MADNTLLTTQGDPVANAAAPNKRYLITRDSLPDKMSERDAAWFEQNQDKLYSEHSDAHAFEVSPYDENDEQETDQYIITVEGQDGVSLRDGEWWGANKNRLFSEYPDANVERVRYVDYWGPRAEQNRARRNELEQVKADRAKRLAELGYYDDTKGDEQAVQNMTNAQGYGLKPVSSVMHYNVATGQQTYSDPRVQEFFATDNEYNEANAEIARLDAEYDANPAVIEYRKRLAEWEAEKARANEILEEEIRANAAAEEGDVERREMRKMAPMLGMGGLTGTAQFNSMYADAELPDAASENYSAALSMMNRIKELGEISEKGFGGAVLDYASESFDRLRHPDLMTYAKVGDILTRLEQKVGDLRAENLTDEVIEQNLTKDEQALIRAFFAYNTALADAGNDMSAWYKGGKIFAESIPFMLEFLVTGGAYRAAGRAATSWMGKGFAKWIAKSAPKTLARTAKKYTAKVTSGAVKGLVGTAARTMVQPSTYVGAVKATTEIGDDGHLHKGKNAFVSIVDKYIENLSEISGEAITGGLKILGAEAGKGFSSLIGQEAFEKMGAWYADSALMQGIARFMPKLEVLGFHGMPVEIGEEFVGNIIREFTIQPGALEEMVSDDNFGAMVIGFAPMTLLGVAGGAATLYTVNKQAAQIGSELEAMLSGHHTKQEIDHMLANIQNARNGKEMQQAIKPMALSVLQAAQEGTISQEEANAEVELLYQYGSFMAQNAALVFGKKAQDKQLMDARRTRYTDMYGRFWQEDGAETVQVATLNDGRRVFVMSTPTEDGSIVIMDITTGAKGKANMSDVATHEEKGKQVPSMVTMSMASFLHNDIAMQRRTEEMTRMQNERDAQIKALQQQIVPGTVINLGTEGSPINVIARGTNARGVVVVDSTGMESTVGWDQAAYALGQPIKVDTDQEKLEAEVAARLQRLAERRMKNRPSPVTSATVGAANQAAAEAAATAENQNIPLNEDGTVNEALFWSQDPEGYVKWNDEQNKDGGQDSLKQIAIAKQELFGMLNEVATGQNTSNPTMRKAAEKQVAAIAEKIARLEAMEQSYADARAEEIEAVKQTAATPTATMSEEQLEQMDAQYQGILGKTRVQSERVRVMQEYLDKLAEESFPVVVLTRTNYAEKMKAEGCEESRIKVVERYVKLGKSIGGFTSNGKLFLMEEGLPNINEARVTYVHERQHALNTQNPEFVRAIVEAASGNREMLVEWVKSFVGNEMDAYETLTSEGLADELICRCMEIAYTSEEFSVDLQSRGIPSEVISIITEIDNEQRSSKSLANARRRGRRNENANVNIEGGVEENGRDSGQVSGGILGNEAVGSSGSSNGGAQAGEGAEVTPEGPAFRIAETNPEVNLSEETKQELSDKGLVMEGGAIMSEDYAALKHEAAYLTPIEKGAASDDLRFSVTTMPGWKKNYLQYKDADERIVRVLEAFADRMTANEMVNGVIAQGKHKSSKKTKDGKLVESGPLRSNISYVVTFDLDTSCPRSLQYLNYVKRIERSIGRPMTQIECIQLTEMMRMYGQQIPCVYCYAENKRQAMKQYFNNYIDARHAVLTAETDEEALKHMYGRVAEGTDPETVLTEAAYKVFVKWRKNPKAMYNPSMRMLWNQYDQARNSILSLLDMRYSEGAVKTDSSDETIAKFIAADLGATNKTALKAIEEIVVEWKWNTIEGRKHDDFTPVEEDDIWANENALEVWRDMTLYAKSASGAKNVNRYVPYTDELKNVDQATRDYINGMGGLRMHSTNDFRIDYVFDYFQFLADMAAAKMFGHTYSKSPEFVRIFGNSGYKINMSIAAYQDENGVIRPNVDEGFDWNEAKELRKLFPHAGTMLMATSDEQLQMALDSDWIDMCIPFHHSGLPKAVWYNMRLWTDYTTVQNERYLNNEERIAMLAEAGVEIPKRASTEAIEELFNEHFGIEVLYGKSGKRVKPHFLPGPTIVDGVDIPGHNNNHELYLELCKKYGVKPRFEGIKVKDNTPEGGGREIDITQHPRYMILIKETARTDTPQTAIQFNFDQPSEALGGKTPMDYAFEELEARAMAEADIAGGKVKNIYNSLNNDSFGIVNQFLNTIIKHKQETGEDYPMDYLTPESREWFMVQRKALEEAFKDIETIPYHRNEYDEQGNLVKGEGLERADEAEDGLRLRITPEQDKAYMDAVEAGDMETAQRMVDEAAEAAGYTIRGEHGRVSKFTVFDRRKANPEGNWGQGFYFTNNSDDAEYNYGSVDGPDLQAKIDREVERRANNAYYDDVYEDEEAIREAVEKEFITDDPNVVSAAIKMDNPFVVGHGMVEIGDDGLGHYDMQETYLTVEYETDEEGEIDYDSEPTGTLIDLVDALNEELSNYEWSRVNASEILYDNIDGMTASQFEQEARELLDTAGITDESGDYIMTSEIIRAAIERAGFDGIIDNTVNQKFGDARRYGQSMAGVNRDTRHYIAFESSQIKDTDPVTYDDAGNVIPLSERFNPENADIRFSIIGERGAKADKTPEGVTRYANLAVARQMESELKPDWSAKENEAALKIKVATGWERGADGKWRYETSDIQMRPIEDWLFNKKKMTLKDIVEPGILLDLYPELGDVVIVKNKSVTDNGAWYNDATNEMELPFAFMRRVHELAQTDESWQQKLGAWTQDLKESIIHETQHYIQDKEEFARGGNESIVIDPAAREIIDEYVEEMGKYARVYDALAASEKSQSYGKFLAGQYNAYSKKVQDLMKQFGIGREGYEKLGGEVESRNTEKRSSMTSEARRQSLLASTEDVAREDQILIDNDFRLMESEVRFSIANSNQAIFVSNAAKAVEGIKMEKATPAQWLAMIEKNGGLKAGEDKWMGLSDWLKASDKKTLTKAEVLDFINENMIVIEEQHYGEIDETQVVQEQAAQSIVNGASLEELQEIINEHAESASRYDAENEDEDFDLDEWLMDIMVDEYGDDFGVAYTIEDGTIEFADIDWWDISRERMEDRFGVRPIDDTRLEYTTLGLQNFHEIALTVPTILPWETSDYTHFGDAGDGRAVAWIRFGDTKIVEEGSLMEYEPKDDVEREIKDYIEMGMSRWGYPFEECVGYAYNQITDAPSEAVGWTEEAVTAVANGMRGKEKARKILVIDEIQSNRHQEGRKRGYKDIREIRAIQKRKAEIDAEIKSLAGAVLDGDRAAKRQQDALFREHRELSLQRVRGEIPDAPFEKNWPELAMKRMLRYAAENGYDVIAWTKGDQQAQRYDLSQVVKKISTSKQNNEGERIVNIYYRDESNDYKNLVVDKDGKVIYGDFFGSNLAEIVGKEMALQIMSSEDRAEFKGDGLRVGGEGMRGFYDKMLPAFMNKYGKKWGVKVEDINLPNLENGLTMHSVPVTEEMKASVMEGQVMFRTSPISKEVQDEMNIIAATAIVDGNYLKAPNGADTNLTPEQWAMVRTKNFKNWFGDWENDPENASKVVDENGEPMVVYHGSPYGSITAFDRKGRTQSGLREFGTYFSTNKELAQLYANARQQAKGDIERYELEKARLDAIIFDNETPARVALDAFDELDRLEESQKPRVYEVFLNIRQPKVFDAEGKDGWNGWHKLRQDVGYDVKYGTEAIEAISGHNKAARMDQSYDGIIAKNIADIHSDEVAGYLGDVFLVFDENPNHIKSATDNTGEFSKENEDIRFKTASLEKRERERFAKTLYAKVLQNQFNDVTLQEIDKFIQDAADNDELRISQRLPEDVERSLYEGKRESAINALFGRISESAVPAAERTSKSGREQIANKKKELLKGWAIASGLWYDDLSQIKEIASLDAFDHGTESDVYLSSVDGYIVKIKKGKSLDRKFPPDIDDLALFNYYFKNAEYTIIGYGDFGEGISTIVMQPLVDFNEVAYLSEEERIDFMRKLGFEPMRVKSAFTNGYVVASDIRRGNIVRDKAGNVRVIDADMRYHTKDYGGKHVIPPVEKDWGGGPLVDESEKNDGDTRFRIIETPTAEVVANGLQLTSAQTAKIAGDIFAALPEESRKKITEGLGSIFDMKDAIMQIPASLASKENWNEEDVKVANVVRAAMQDAMDENAATSRPLTTKEALWVLYNVISPETDIFASAQKAIVAHRLGFDPASMERRQRTDDHIRFSIASQGPIDAAVDMYNYETSLWTERLKESWLDMNQSVVSLQRAMEDASGMPIEPWENTEYALNRLSSKSYADKKKYLRDYLMPLWDVVLDIVKHDHVSIEEIERYMMLKHGLERNKVFASRDAKAFYRDMFEVVAERMKNQSHAEQVVALSEANKALADIRAKMANAQGKKLADLQEAEKRAIVDVEIANLVLRGDEQQNEADLQAHYNDIDNGVDAKYKEFRDKDYGGLTSMFVDTTDVKRSDYLSEEAYQRAVQAASVPRFSKVADMEAEAQKEVDDFESRVYMYPSLWDHVNAATKETLRHQFASGMITQEQYDSVRNMFQFYVPMRGFADNTAEDMYSYYMTNGAGGFAKPLIGAKGRKTRAESPLGWIGTMAESAIQADNKNMAKMTLYYAALRRPDLGVLSITETWFEYTGQKDANGKKIFKAAYPPAVDRVLTADELRQHMEDWENDMKQKQSRGEAYRGSQRVNLQGSVVFQDAKEDQEHAVRVKVAGEDYSILINGNPRAAQAINGLLNPDANVGPAMEWVNGLRRNLSALLTSYSPLFWVANYQRDLLSSTMRTSEASGWGAAGKYLANRRHAWAVLSYINKLEDGRLGNSYYEDLYREFAENGGITGYTSLTTNKEYEKLLEKYANSVDKTLLNDIKNVWDKFMGIGEGIEQVTRFAAYITAREEGKPIEEAINAAKEVSVNFNRKGSAKPISLDELDKLRTKDGKKLNAAQRTAAIVLSAMPGPMKWAYYFMNASIQSLSSSAKLAKKSPGKASTWVGFYMGLSVGLAMLNYLLSGDDDDEYLNLPDYLRHSTAMFKVADGYYVKWSIPQEMRPFYAWADILVRKMMDKMPHKSGWEVGKEMALAAAQWLPLNPFESEDPLLSLVPDFLSPVAEVVANTNAFGGKIYDDMSFKSEGVVKEIPAYRKATEKTGKVYVDVSKFLNDVTGGDEVMKGSININPAIVEHLVEGYGGGIYDFAKMMISLPSLILSDEPMQVKDIPFVNKVVLSVDETNMYSHTNEAFYHYKDIADNAKRVEAEYRKSDDPSRADAYREEEDWRIYMLYKQYEADFKAVKDKLEKALDKEEEALLKQEQNVLREMFLNDIATGNGLDPVFAMKEGLKERDKQAREAMKPYNDAEKLRKERKKLQDFDGAIAASEKKDSIRQTPQYQRAKAERAAVKEFNKRIDSLGLMPSRAQRDSLQQEILKDYEEFMANE